MLSITLFCAALFLGVKTFEYTEKAHKRLLWAGASVDAKDIGKAENSQVFRLGDPNDPKNFKDPNKFEERMMKSLVTIQNYGILSLLIPAVLIGIGYQRNSRPWRTTGYAGLISIFAILIGIFISIELHNMQHGGGGHGEQASAEHDGEHASGSHEGSDHDSHDEGKAHSEGEAHAASDTDSADHGHADENAAPRNANIFFSIYYFMTGLHGFHIIAGMVAITWLLVRAVESHFRPDYFGPVDYVGLYWHIVDLIWIFLFPLLYLIGS
ncbi:MAG: cytochrome c oxidase subunit 3 [Planctomycetaceae bacterium]|nr:cytochrome c oxidase subunit 3 [Planctomycetaceae bacterium]